MKYTKPVDIHALTDDQRQALQPGQWVHAGPRCSDPALGRYLGTTHNGRIVVVAWQGNARAAKDYRGYVRTLRDYALGR